MAVLAREEMIDVRDLDDADDVEKRIALKKEQNAIIETELDYLHQRTNGVPRLQFLVEIEEPPLTSAREARLKDVAVLEQHLNRLKSAQRAFLARPSAPSLPPPAVTRSTSLQGERQSRRLGPAAATSLPIAQTLPHSFSLPASSPAAVDASVRLSPSAKLPFTEHDPELATFGSPTNRSAVAAPPPRASPTRPVVAARKPVRRACPGPQGSPVSPSSANPPKEPPPPPLDMAEPAVSTLAADATFGAGTGSIVAPSYAPPLPTRPPPAGGGGLGDFASSASASIQSPTGLTTATDVPATASGGGASGSGNGGVISSPRYLGGGLDRGRQPAIGAQPAATGGQDPGMMQRQQQLHHAGGQRGAPPPPLKRAPQPTHARDQQQPLRPQHDPRLPTADFKQQQRLPMTTQRGQPLPPLAENDPFADTFTLSGHGPPPSVPLHFRDLALDKPPLPPPRDAPEPDPALIVPRAAGDQPLPMHHHDRRRRNDNVGKPPRVLQHAPVPMNNGSHAFRASNAGPFEHALGRPFAGAAVHGAPAITTGNLRYDNGVAGANQRQNLPRAQSLGPHGAALPSNYDDSKQAPPSAGSDGGPTKPPAAVSSALEVLRAEQERQIADVRREQARRFQEIQERAKHRRLPSGGGGNGQKAAQPVEKRPANNSPHRDRQLSHDERRLRTLEQQPAAQRHRERNARLARAGLVTGDANGGDDVAGLQPPPSIVSGLKPKPKNRAAPPSADSKKRAPVQEEKGSGKNARKSKSDFGNGHAAVQDNGDSGGITDSFLDNYTTILNDPDLAPLRAHAKQRRDNALAHGTKLNNAPNHNRSPSGGAGGKNGVGNRMRGVDSLPAPNNARGDEKGDVPPPRYQSPSPAGAAGQKNANGYAVPRGRRLRDPNMRSADADAPARYGNDVRVGASAAQNNRNVDFNGRRAKPRPQQRDLDLVVDARPDDDDSVIAVREQQREFRAFANAGAAVAGAGAGDRVAPARRAWFVSSLHEESSGTVLTRWLERQNRGALDGASWYHELEAVPDATLVAELRLPLTDLLEYALEHLYTHTSRRVEPPGISPTEESLVTSFLQKLLCFFPSFMHKIPKHDKMDIKSIVRKAEQFGGLSPELLSLLRDAFSFKPKPRSAGADDSRSVAPSVIGGLSASASSLDVSGGGSGNASPGAAAAAAANGGSGSGRRFNFNGTGGGGAAGGSGHFRASSLSGYSPNSGGVRNVRGGAPSARSSKDGRGFRARAAGGSDKSARGSGSVRSVRSSRVPSTRSDRSSRGSSRRGGYGSGSGSLRGSDDRRRLSLLRDKDDDSPRRLSKKVNEHRDRGRDRHHDHRRRSGTRSRSRRRRHHRDDDSSSDASSDSADSESSSSDEAAHDRAAATASLRRRRERERDRRRAREQAAAEAAAGGGTRRLKKDEQEALIVRQLRLNGGGVRSRDDEHDPADAFRRKARKVKLKRDSESNGASRERVTEDNRKRRSLGPKKRTDDIESSDTDEPSQGDDGAVRRKPKARASETESSDAERERSLARRKKAMRKKTSKHKRRDASPETPKRAKSKRKSVKRAPSDTASDDDESEDESDASADRKRKERKKKADSKAKSSKKLSKADKERKREKEKKRKAPKDEKQKKDRRDKEKKKKAKRKKKKGKFDSSSDDDQEESSSEESDSDSEPPPQQQALATVPDTRCNVYVASVRVNTRKEFERLLGDFGVLESVHYQHASHFGFALFKYHADAVKCIEALNGKQIGPSRVQARFADREYRTACRAYNTIGGCARPNCRERHACMNCLQPGHSDRECSKTCRYFAAGRCRFGYACPCKHS